MKEHLKIIIIIIITTGVVLGGLVISGVLKKACNEKSEKIATNANSTTNVNSASWYAVFLSNGQVYFGKLKDVDGQYVMLTDIYYLQLDKPLQSNNPKDAVKETENQSKLSLMKLGKEVHGPNDQMVLNRDHLLFYEELTPDSKVVKSIQKYKSEQKN